MKASELIGKKLVKLLCFVGIHKSDGINDMTWSGPPTSSQCVRCSSKITHG